MICHNDVLHRQAIVQSAEEWIGTPYQHQASVKGLGCDCLGLVRGIWREHVGPEPVALLEYGPSWADVTGVEIFQQALHRYFKPTTIDPIKVGSVILFRMQARSIAKHVAITVGCDGEQPLMIHSYNNRGVVLAPLNTAWLRRSVGQFNFPRRIVSWQQ